MTSYEQGFLTKCAEYGVDGRMLLQKLAGPRSDAYFAAAERAKQVYKNNPALARQILQQANQALLGYGSGSPVYDVPNAAPRMNSAALAASSRDGTHNDKVNVWANGQ